LDRINRIVRIMRPSAERSLAAGEKISDYPVNPVKIKIIKIESIPHPFNYLKRFWVHFQSSLDSTTAICQKI